MKRLALLGAVAALAAVALPALATAGQLSGVVVAKDAARRSVAVATRGDVHTVRTARFGALKVGQRITATGAALGDGTFSARAVRAGGKAKEVRFRAVVVRHEAAKRRLIVSAGGTVFAFRFATGPSFASDGGLSPGDKVTVSADVKKHELEAHRGDVKETGHVEALKLEGIFLHQGQDSFDIAVVHRGLVHIRFKPGTELPDWKPGDIVFVVVSVGSDGAFAFVGGRTDGKPGDSKPGDDAKTGDHSTGDLAKVDVEVYGVLTERSSAQVGVLREDGTTVACAVPAGLDLSLFRIGEKVKMFCRKRDAGLVLGWLKSERASIKDDGRGEAYFGGTLADAQSGAVSVRLEDGSLVTCPLAKALDLAAFKPGEKVKLTCLFREGKLVFGSLKSEFAYINSDGTEFGLYGVLTTASSGTISVQRSEGGSLSCSLPAWLDVSAVAIGQKAMLGCKVREGVLVFASLTTGELWLKADGTGERTLYGTLVERGAETVTVKREDGSQVSCAAPASIDLSAFHAGDKVKMRCRLKEGQWRLWLLRSETATVEIPL
jgi:hypothetical protein